MVIRSAALLWLCAATRFVLLHGPSGQEYYVAIDQITTLRAPVDADAASFAKGVRCIVVTTAAKFVPATESCSDIYAAVMKATR